jgi:Putative auto-transporter adhesin, head GIN domain
LDRFSILRIEGAGHAVITIGARPSVTVTANDIVLDLIDVNVEGDTLTVGRLATSALDIAGLDEIEYEITAPSLSEIHLNGTINAEIDELEVNRSLTLGMTTGAEISIGDLRADELDAKLDLASTAHIAGQVEQLTLESLKESNFDGENLSVQTAEVTIRTLGKATVRVEAGLNGEVSEGGELNYITEAALVHVESRTRGVVNELPFTPWVDPSEDGTPAAGA